MKDFTKMQVSAKELKSYRLRFFLNGYPTTARYESLDHALIYLDSLVKDGGKISELQIIDADKLICAIDGAESLDSERDYDEIARFIEEAETADVEEVVRCKDCAYCVDLFSCDKHEEQTRRCQRFGLNLIHGDGYCFWAQRVKEKEK